jgi:hypothetical protein
VGGILNPDPDSVSVAEEVADVEGVKLGICCPTIPLLEAAVPDLAVEDELAHHHLTSYYR